ncbi:MAG: bifunctional [glutamate--ammonia ligase]-adenylyl-L-tyrosine phosphorylase/[glutamate--ammonia-ligase] adenylyltransferase [Thermodesulfobacteriota bacterium]|nr:bifunctional [glutamate--ammonia ligase]-adenylyl-L-tyrosine phosphorylase/[glutamate--ammonia-ligase] adenylyltransferase [Thermodesulfobacteriota bacterium]
MAEVGTVLLPFLRSGDAEQNNLFEQAVTELGFSEAAKTVTNLTLLCTTLNDQSLVADIAAIALECSDPDMALNNLERCSDCVEIPQLISCLTYPRYRRQLLLMLGASSFLSGILCRHADYLSDLFTQGEVDCRKDTSIMRGELERRLSPHADFDELQRCLRQYKYREVLRISARDLSGVADLVEVTAELSSLAAATLQVACEHCQRMLQVEYGQPLVDETADSDEENRRGMEEATFTVLGMGKLGGWELNFSSDIDLIYFYSTSRGRTSGVVDDRGVVKNQLDLHQYFIKLAEWLTSAIGQITADGFVFRVDLDLRPEGRSGEMACSQTAAEAYYEGWGQSWERSAMMKACPVAGNIELGERLLGALEPFIYRRYVDYGMVDDLKQMKQKIDRHQAQQQDCENNLKLGKGGIREIEFFTQAVQLVFAGKDPQVRERSTLKALYLLRDEEYVPAEDTEVLRSAYIFLRTVEHRIQVVQERQTHSLPTDELELLHLARRCGFADYGTFKQVLDGHRDEVTRIYRGLFYVSEDEAPDEVKPVIRFILNSESDSDLVKDILEEHGFCNPDSAYDSIMLLSEGRVGLPMTQRVRRYYGRILPVVVQAVLDALEPDMTLNNVEAFLLRVRAQGAFYAMLAENNAIIHLLISLFDTSKLLSRIFIRRPELLDSLVTGSHVITFKTRDELRSDLVAQMAQDRDYEDHLDTLRRFRNEEFLRIAFNDLMEEVLQGNSLKQLSNLAIVCLEAAVDMARAELIPRFGMPFYQDDDGQWQKAQFAVLGMGKLGGLEINYHSDLDIIFIYDRNGKNRPVEGTEHDRFKQLSNQEYFSKLAQRIISVLTLAARDGRVYEIDTRLRPSGNQGPLVTSLSAYEIYHQSLAQLWERQALTKAQVVVGSPEITAKINHINKQITWEKALPAEFQAEVYRLRQRMEKEIALEGKNRFNIKTGRGGMVDVEFLVQYLQLKYGATIAEIRVPNTMEALQALREKELLPVDDADVFSDGYKYLRRLENKLRLIHDQSFNQISTEKSSLRKLARRLGYTGETALPEDEFMTEYKQVTEQIRGLFERYLAPC